jgi:ASC-1-like (ASCH) protein
MDRTARKSFLVAVEPNCEGVRSMKHDLKLSTEFFGSVLVGIKTFEIRFNDRNYKVGDTLVLKEFNTFTEAYTGREIEKKVTYITNYAQQDGFIVMSIA